jgi:phosphoglycerol transferase MdoB-like AlkP superfamily enzyme
MFTPQDLFIDALWVLGLAGVLATLSYMSWYRNLRRWSWRTMSAMPLMLSPLCFSLALFCLGMALNGAGTDQSSPWWQTAAWSVLTLLFAVQCVMVTRDGRRKGWDTPIEGSKEP